ncbi:unnamed protein product [Coffea canephora]|uniref:Protein DETOXIFICATION n=1 Tax=Coffea canephora TaxID=49390 RepID=A0A068UY67_COFCA|nr:unnamed protein product [Coffea canephora]
MEDGEKPLLSHMYDGNGQLNPQNCLTPPSEKLWYLAGPSIFTSICQYGIGALTQIFAGQLGTIQLAAIAVENCVIAAFGYGILMGMGSALETLCGQAYGANRHNMLGIYMQRSWVILNTLALWILPLFIFATPILKLFGQNASIAKEGGKFALWMIPQQFAYAITIPLAKFLQAQSKVMEMAVISAIAVCLHAFLGWLVMMKLRLGLLGAALMLNASWWFITIGQFLYVMSGNCGRSWSGFSWKALRNLSGFAKLSVSSAVMLSLEVWCIMALTLAAGYLPNAEISVDALSICMNIIGWSGMVGLGFNVAISVTVSKKLGCGRPRAAKFAVIVVGLTAFLFGLIFALILLLNWKDFPALFTDSAEVQQLVQELCYMVVSTFENFDIQYGLDLKNKGGILVAQKKKQKQGTHVAQVKTLVKVNLSLGVVKPCVGWVAIGAGWQNTVALINAGCYFLLGVPLSLVTGFKFDMGVKGIWYGMLFGLSLQAGSLPWMTIRTNWNKEAYAAEERLKLWGGETEAQIDEVK